MLLTKHHGLGNDFLVVLDETNVDLAPIDGDLARRLCHRRTGIGADGLIHGALAGRRTDSGVVMHLYNADGSRAEMSGNGARCLAQAVAAARDDASLHVVIDTDGGARSAVVDAPMGLSDAWVTIDMGPAHPGPEVPSGVHQRVDGRIETVDLGNPHLVIDGPDPDLVDLANEGAWIEKQFAEGINVEYASVIEANVLALTVWERGAGITQACGTGACAAAYAFQLWGLVGGDVEVRMPGGAAFVTLGDTITLAGPTSLIATIEVDND